MLETGLRPVTNHFSLVLGQIPQSLHRARIVSQSCIVMLHRAMGLRNLGSSLVSGPNKLYDFGKIHL